MPWSGSTGSQSFSRTDGTRTGTSVWQDAEAALVDIVSDDHDTHDQDVADGINSCLKKDGGNTMTAVLRMGGFRIVNVGTGTSSTDAVNKAQMDAAVAGAGDGFPSTTRMIFSQTSAPTGWTKITSATHNNAALRFTTGSAGTGGSSNFTSVFTNRNISQDNLPNTNLSAANLTVSGAPGLTGSQSGGLARSVSRTRGGSEGTAGSNFVTEVSWNDTTLTPTAGTLGVGGHVKLNGGVTQQAMDFAVKYVDCIVAEKD